MFQPSSAQWNIPSSSHQSTERHGIKRKNLITPDTILPPPPEKHFVTEEEMTAEMRRLQIMEPISGANMHPIGTNFTVPQTNFEPQLNGPSTSWFNPMNNKINPYPYFQEPTSETCTQPFLFNSQGQFSGFGSNNNTEFDKDMESDDSKKYNSPRLFISDDVYKVEPDAILPHSLMKQLPERNLALVPWVPPILSVLKDKTEETDEYKDDNEMEVIM